VDVTIASRSARGLFKPGVWGVLLVLVGGPVLAAEFPTKNKQLQRALRLYEAFEYEEALRVLDKAEQVPTNTQEDKVNTALLEALLSYETQQPVRGDRAFQRALDLDPNAKLPFKVSPKLAARLEELRAEAVAKKTPQPPPRVEPPPPPVVTDTVPQPKATRRMNLKLPVAIGGSVVALGGILAVTQSKSLEGKVRDADSSIDSRKKLEDTLSQARTFNTVGWVLMGLGAATTAGSLLFLDMPPEGAKATVTPVAHGAQLSISWSFR